jgi:hypothetical protein
MPDSGEPCDGSVYECEYGSDPRVGCNAMALCEGHVDGGLIWLSGSTPTWCEPIVAQCDNACLDATTPCLDHGQLCYELCAPLRDAALGCPCDASTTDMLCKNGHYEQPPPPKH